MKKGFTSNVLALGLLTALASFNVVADNNGGGRGEVGTQDAPVGSLAPNLGNVLCTAAVNSTGTLASSLVGSFALSSSKVGLGTYQVLFKAPCTNVTAATGWARFVQVDTLTTGTTSGHCATADRAGSVNGVWIACFDAAGAPADRSFFLSVTR